MARSVGTAYVNRMHRSTAASGRRSEERIRADRRSIIKILSVVMIAIFVLVGMRSYAAILQHENNVLAEQNEYLQAEIDSISSRIVEETKVTKIEKIATEQYGMVFPTSDNCIRLGDDGEETGGLAAAIRSEAYN